MIILKGDRKVMTQIFGAPGRYIQGYGELKRIRQHLEWMGKSFTVIASKNRIKSLSSVILESFGEGFEITFVEFQGESSRKEISRIQAIANEKDAKCIIGLGGGKVIDTAKAVAAFSNLSCVIIPTIAATDASTGALSVIYNEDGSMESEVHYNKSPEAVIVDTEIIMKAPVRFLVAGMGDAISSYFGGRVAFNQYSDNEFGAKPTWLGYVICQQCYDILMKHGQAAKIACENNVMTDDLNKVIEVNVLLSGLGMESGGCAADHSFYYAFCALNTREEDMYHGEYVAFSVLAQLIMEGAPKEEIDKVYKFCLSVGLPVTLADIHMDNLTEEECDVIANVILEQDGPKHYPFEITREKVLGSMWTADAIGNLYKKGDCLI
jgi:glycerol dehydrogenase